MSHAKCKTGHAGAKNRGGFHGTRAEAKVASPVKRRTADKATARLARKIEAETEALILGGK
jgi:hypothetical protein